MDPNARLDYIDMCEFYESQERLKLRKRIMPCRCDYMEDNATEEALRKEIDKLTQNLCYLCGTISDDNSELTQKDIMTSNPRLAKWWEEHQEADTARVKEQMMEYIKTYKPIGSNAVAEDFILIAKSEHPVSDFHKHWFYKTAAEVMTEYAEEFQTKQDMIESINNKLSTEELKLIKEQGAKVIK